MMLETLIAEAARNGLRAFTLWQLQDGRWQASSSPDRTSWSVSIDADPIVAVRSSLNNFAQPAAPVIAENIFA